MEQNRRRQLKNVLEKIGACIIALIFWQVAAMFIHQRILLVTPVEVAARLFTIWKEQEFFTSLIFTSVHIIGGFIIGFSVGTILAILSHNFPVIKTLLWPWMAVVKAVPVASFVVICLIWLSAGNLSIFISFLIVVPVVYQNILAGLDAQDEKLMEMAEVFDMSAYDKWKYITLAQLAPYIRSAAAVTAGMAWKAGVAAEVIGTPNGSIGRQLYLSKIYLATDDLLAWTVIILLLSVAFEKFVMWLLSEEHLIPKVTVKAAENNKTVNEKEKAGTSEHIVVSELKKEYEGKTVLNNVSLEIPFGSRILVTGPSGCGKTTFARILLNLEKQYTGSITGLLDSKACVFQEDRLCENYSAKDNIMLAARVSSDEAEYYLRELGLESLMDRKTATLSGGEKRRVAIARALAADYKLLILDEPYKGLDDKNLERVRLFVESESKDKTVIMISHDNREKNSDYSEIIRL